MPDQPTAEELQDQMLDKLREMSTNPGPENMEVRQQLLNELTDLAEQKIAIDTAQNVPKQRIS